MKDNTSTDPRPDNNNKAPAPPPRNGRLWIWYVTGFLIVFIGMSLVITMVSMHPSGQFVVECKLWEYYILEIRRELNSSGNLGPATGSSSAAVTTAAEHLLCSAVGGAVMLGIVWTVRRIIGRQRAPA